MHSILIFLDIVFSGWQQMSNISAAQADQQQATHGLTVESVAGNPLLFWDRSRLTGSINDYSSSGMTGKYFTVSQYH